MAYMDAQPSALSSHALRAQNVSVDWKDLTESISTKWIGRSFQTLTKPKRLRENCSSWSPTHLSTKRRLCLRATARVLCDAEAKPHIGNNSRSSLWAVPCAIFHNAPSMPMSRLNSSGASLKSRNALRTSKPRLHINDVWIPSRRARSERAA